MKRDKIGNREEGTSESVNSLRGDTARYVGVVKTLYRRQTRLGILESQYRRLTRIVNVCEKTGREKKRERVKDRERERESSSFCGRKCNAFKTGRGVGRIID